MGTLTSGNLMIGLLDPSNSGPGFTSLHFTVSREGSLVEDQTFASLATAMTYFNDNVLNLGALASNVVGKLDLSISLAMVSPDNNTRFGDTQLIADVGPTANPPGDYNNNDIVDAADCVLWREKNNTATTLPTTRHPAPSTTAITRYGAGTSANRPSAAQAAGAIRRTLPSPNRRAACCL